MSSIRERVEQALSRHKTAVRKTNLDTIKKMQEKGYNEEQLRREFRESDRFRFPADQLEDHFDELDQKYNLSGFEPRNLVEFTEEDAKKYWKELELRVRADAIPEFQETLTLPEEIDILFSMVNELHGSGLPDHVAAISMSLDGGYGWDPKEKDPWHDDWMGAYDRNGFNVLRGAAWPLGEPDHSGYIPWAIWCKLVDDEGEEQMPWAWRYAFCHIETDMQLLYDVDELLDYLAKWAPEKV